MAATTLDSIDIANILAQELLFQQLVSLDGLHSGVPTRTTPTLTPTTLRSIEQTFLEFTSETGSHSREAGFVPPLIEPSQPTPAQTQNTATIAHHQQQQQLQPEQQQPQQQQQHNGVLLELQQTQPQQQPLQEQQQQQPQTTTTRRNMGGRRPTRTVGMSPEEEERRQIRRERNKMAAARCRKRRMDHTNALLEETEGLEKKKQSLQDELCKLQQAKEELEFVLETHKNVCRLQSSSPPDVKPVVPEHLGGKPGEPGSDLQHEEFSELPCSKPNEEAAAGALNGLRPNRPNSLPVGFDGQSQPDQRNNGYFTQPKPRPSSLQFKTLETPTFMKAPSEIVAGIPITTPSTGIPFNFDSLMEGGTGLTPVSTPLVPSCSTQQRSNGVNGHSHHLSAVDLSSPDANPPKLVSL
jgi:fos-like antigen